ncbi:MAG: Gfo/Idh/MocA family oxidoreductase, partial [Candidatus Bipolaricaulota bacterium]
MEIVAVCDLVEGAAQECSEEWGIPDSHGEPDPILGSDRVDAVFICTSTDTHAQLIEAAAAAGKHIFCEKPIALDLPSIDRALAAVEAAGVKLQIGFNRRFDPNFREARERVAAGDIGTPNLLRITSRDPAPPPISYIESSGGIFLDMTIHDFDMARYIMRDEVHELFAQGAARIDPRIGEAGDVDTATVALRFASGALGIIENSRQATYGYDQRLEVLGDKGRVLVGNPLPHTAVLSD